jgi:hypothetical protein
MYRTHHNGQLSIEEFHVPFGGTLDPEKRWVLFAMLMPSDAGLIQSPSQVLLPRLRAWVEVGGMASSLCPKAPLLQPISI